MEQLSDNQSPNGRQIENQVFRAIADCTYDWESWHEPTGRLVWVNAAVERITGYRPEECLQMLDYPLPMVAASDRQKMADVMRDAQAGGSGNDAEFQVEHRDGLTRWAAVSWQPMYDQSGRHLGFRASVRDISERRRLREQLRQHNQHLEQLVQERTAKIAQLEEQRLKMEALATLGQMAASVAHEVNNPLAGIRNAFALFKSNLSPDDENYQLLELIDGEIERISSITHQMHQLYRPSQQPPRKFDLLRAASNVTVLTEPLATTAQVAVVAESQNCQPYEDLRPTEVVLKEGELIQVLLNVVKNAIEASPPGGQVTIAFSTSPHQTEITVTDQGPGVPEGIAEKIFEPFFSSKSETSRHGMGLGLSVSKSLVEAMGGSIVVISPPKQGTRVQIKLPRRLTGLDSATEPYRSFDERE